MQFLTWVDLRGGASVLQQPESLAADLCNFECLIADAQTMPRFHSEMSATAEVLSKALAHYAHRSDAALASFMEKASARGVELEVSATARLNQFCGLPANGSLPDVDDIPLAHTPTNADVLRIAAAAERAVADGQHVESDSNHKPQSGRSIPPVKPGQAA